MPQQVLRPSAATDWRTVAGPALPSARPPVRCNGSGRAWSNVGWRFVQNIEAKNRAALKQHRARLIANAIATEMAARWPRAGRRQSDPAAGTVPRWG